MDDDEIQALFANVLDLQAKVGALTWICVYLLRHSAHFPDPSEFVENFRNEALFSLLDDEVAELMERVIRKVLEEAHPRSSS